MTTTNLYMYIKKGIMPMMDKIFVSDKENVCFSLQYDIITGTLRTGYVYSVININNIPYAVSRFEGKNPVHTLLFHFYDKLENNKPIEEFEPRDRWININAAVFLEAITRIYKDLTDKDLCKSEINLDGNKASLKLKLPSDKDGINAEEFLINFNTNEISDNDDLVLGEHFKMFDDRHALGDCMRRVSCISNSLKYVRDYSNIEGVLDLMDLSDLEPKIVAYEEDYRLTKKSIYSNAVWNFAYQFNAFDE